MQHLDTKSLLWDTWWKQEKRKIFPCAVRKHISTFISEGLKMKTLHKAFMIGAAVIGFGATALPAMAEDAPQHQYAATKFDPVKMQERMDEHAKRMHDALKITAAQEGAWQAYLSALKTNMSQRGQFDRAALKDMTAPQRMEKHIEMAKAHIARMESNLAATKTFYSTLTPEQQKVFDEKSSHMGQREHAHMMQHQN